MDTGDPDPFLASLITLDLQVPAFCQRLVVLGDLVGLVKVRVEVVLSRELGFGEHAAVQRFCHPHRILYRTLVEHRHGTRQPETDRADMRVGGVTAVIGGAPAEEFALRVELAVHFKPDNDLAFGHLRSPPVRTCTRHRSRVHLPMACP